MLPGVKVHDPKTVVWAHSPFMIDGGHMGGKSHDFIGCFACADCHDRLDGRVDPGITRTDLRCRFLEAWRKSLVKLHDMGVKIW
jgi:hypothetical protein